MFRRAWASLIASLLSLAPFWVLIAFLSSLNSPSCFPLVFFSFLPPSLPHSLTSFRLQLSLLHYQFHFSVQTFGEALLSVCQALLPPAPPCQAPQVLPLYCPGVGAGAGGPPAGSPSQSVTSGSPRISVLTPGMTWSYWCRTSTQCTVKSLSFWDRPCSSSTVSRRHRTVRLCCSVRGGPLARRTVSHCLCSTTVSALTTCGRARAEVRACGLCTRTTGSVGQPRS